MKKFLFLCLALCAAPLFAQVKVLSTVPEWGALAREIGGERVTVFEATSALQDPHHIEARPSLIARARSAELLLATGADLEIGWLPLLRRESGNRRIQPGQPGYLEMATQVTLRDVPKGIDRAMGDVHPAGDPHFHLDPRNIPPVAKALAARLIQIDPAGTAVYQAHLARFLERWQTALQGWEQAGARLKGLSFLQTHRSFSYLAYWLQMTAVGELEPKPGITPGSGHLSQIVAQQKVAPAKVVLRAAYQDDKAARWVSEQTGIPLLTLPFTVGGTPEARDLFGLFDDTLKRLQGIPQ
ncbi:MAG: zinc ABC transporter substrate-binding protein [Zoogloeaceae bacterium]|jgi:zinc/manganese transport system substrate-binding protein|nr:zinc ABC transporter substrate-binding protein [Zoogloeaceae bacterium]